MPRVKGSVQTRRRRKKILKMAKGYFGSKKALYRTANEQVMRSLRYSYIGRKERKRDFRKLWIQRINAACQLNNFKYSKLVYGLSLASVGINRKMLADMAVNDIDGFKELINVAQKAIKAYPNGRKDVIKTIEVKPKMAVEVKSKKAETKPALKTEVAKPAVKKDKPAETKAVKKAEPVKETLDFEALKVAELKELAKEKGVPGYSLMKKAELVAALKNLKE